MVKLATRLYSNWSSALRSEYSAHRPAQPVLYLDGTGCTLGSGITHASLGCADFCGCGDADAKQSRATLQPAALYKGNDHAVPQRQNLERVFESYNRLNAQGYVTRDDGTTIPCRTLTTADMQGAKSTYGMLECCHSVWCKCQAAEGGPQHQYPDFLDPDCHIENCADMLEYIETEVPASMVYL